MALEKMVESVNEMCLQRWRMELLKLEIHASSDFILPTQAGQVQPLTNVRRITAERMRASVVQTVPVTLHKKFNAGGLIAYRDRLKGSDLTPSYNDIIMKLAAMLLRECPELNACWTQMECMSMTM